MIVCSNTGLVSVTFVYINFGTYYISSKRFRPLMDTTFE